MKTQPTFQPYPYQPGSKWVDQEGMVITVDRMHEHRNGGWKLMFSTETGGGSMGENHIRRLKPFIEHALPAGLPEPPEPNPYHAPTGTHKPIIDPMPVYQNTPEKNFDLLNGGKPDPFKPETPVVAYRDLTVGEVINVDDEFRRDRDGKWIPYSDIANGCPGRIGEPVEENQAPVRRPLKQPPATDPVIEAAKAFENEFPGSVEFIPATVEAPAAAAPRESQDLTLLTHVFTSGYQRGHESTVEGAFTDVSYTDYETYFRDEVEELVREIAADSYKREVQPAGEGGDAVKRLESAIEFMARANGKLRDELKEQRAAAETWEKRAGEAEERAELAVKLTENTKWLYEQAEAQFSALREGINQLRGLYASYANQGINTAANHQFATELAALLPAQEKAEVAIKVELNGPGYIATCHNLPPEQARQEPDAFDWGIIPSWHHFIAMDASGVWYSYPGRPVDGLGDWAGANHLELPEVLSPPKAEAWRSSLAQRPGGEEVKS